MHQNSSGITSKETQGSITINRWQHGALASALQWFSGLGIATNVATQEVMMSQNTNVSPAVEAVNKQQQQ